MNGSGGEARDKAKSSLLEMDPASEVGGRRPALLENPALTRVLLDSMTEGVSLSTEDGTIVYTNPAEDRLFGYEEGALLGKHVSVQNAYPPEENARIVDDVIAELKRSGAWHGEWLNRRKDGSVFVTKSRISAVEIDGRPHWLCVQEDITEAKAAASALRDSEARLAIATAAAEIGIWDWDLPTNRFVYSPRAKAICGFAPDREVTYEDVRRITHPEDLPRTAAQARRALDPAIRDRSPYLYRIMRPDGEVRRVVAHGEAVFAVVDGQEKAVRFVGTLQDVTERWSLEEMRAASEARLRLAIDAGRMAVWEIDLVTDAVTGSPDLNRILGFPEHAKPTVEQIRSGYMPGELERLRAIGQETLARGERFMEAELRYRTPDGLPKELLLRCEVVRDAEDRPARAVGVLMDVTELKRAESALRESEARFRHMADSAPALIWMTDAEGQLTFANMHYDYVFGRPAAEMLGDGWRSVLLPEDAEQFEAAFFDAFRARRGFRAEVRVLDKRGDVRWLRCEGVARLDDAQRFLGYTGCNVDITDAKVAEAALRELNATLMQRIENAVREREHAEETLRQAQKMEAIGQLTGGLAHDFNNLLTAVVGGLDLIRQRTGEERTRRLAENALQAAERGAKLTGQLLAFSRKQRLELRPLILSDVIEGMEELLVRTLGSGITVHFRLDHSRIPVLGDPTQLELSVLNLAINARDAMPEGGTLTIATKIQAVTADPELQPGEYVELRVSDTGTGMDSEVRARAFDPFFTTKGVGKGTGLGLAQVYGIARQAGGTARIQSEPGHGTTVSLFLPRADGSAPAACREPRAVEAARSRSARVLVVDDDPDARRFVVECLRSLGYDVAEAADGPSGLALASAEWPDVLVLDFAMPGMNGAELASELWRSRPNLPVVFVSGYADTAALQGVVGDVPLIHKPFRTAELFAAVEHALAERRVH